MKKYFLPLCLLYFCLFTRAQEKQIFSESFTENHNNWPLIDKKGLKASISGEKRYDIENRSKNDFTSFVSVPLDLTKDFHIKMTVEDLHYNDKKADEMSGTFNYLIGAKDENSGYLISIGGKSLLIAAVLPNQDHRQMYYGETGNSEKEYLDFRVENNRWKFYNRNGSEIANIPAMPLEGNKMGIWVERFGHYGLTSLTVAEKEKVLIKTDFDLALFMFTYQKLLCSAWNMFKDDIGAQYGTPKDSTWYCKTNVPGFGLHTYLFIHKNTIELLTTRKVNSLDEAYAYYDQALSGIKLTKDTCLELSNNTAQLSTMDFYKNTFVQFESRRSDFRDDHAQKVEGNVLLGLSKVNAESAWLVEFHIILYLSNKVF